MIFHTKNVIKHPQQTPFLFNFRLHNFIFLWIICIYITYTFQKVYNLLFCAWSLLNMNNDKIIAPGKWFIEIDENDNLTKVVHDETFRKILGYEAEEYSNTMDTWIDSVHPDDRQRLLDYLKESKKQHKDGLDYDLEYRMMTKWGYRWFHDYAHCTRRKNGTIERWDGVIFDINDAKTMNANMGALPISHDILKQSKIGLWAFELDEGAEPRMYGDEAMMQLIDVKGPATPEEVYRAWYDNIDKEHYKEVHESVDKMALGVHSEVQYPWHYKDGRTIIVRCGGVKNPHYTKGLRIEGVHRDVTTLVHYEKELFAKVKESEKIIEGFVKNYNTVYKVNLLNDSYITVKADKDMFEQSLNFKKFGEAVDAIISKKIFEPDKQKMRNELRYKTIFQKLETNPTCTVDFRTLSNGVSTWNEMKIATLDENQILIGFTNKNQEIILKKLQQKMNEDYYALFSLDLDTNLIMVLKNAPWYNIAEVGQTKDFNTVINTFLKDIVGDAKIFFSQFDDTDKIKHIFATEDKRTFTYRSSLLNKWINVSLYAIARHNDGSVSTITFGFSYVDSIESERQKLQNLNRENMEIISGFSSEYLAVYYLNFKENTFKVYSVNSQRLSDTRQLLTEDTNPFTLIQKFANSPAVHPDDRNLFEVITKDGIKDLLKNRKKTSIRFRRNYGQGFQWSVMDIVKYEEAQEDANAVTIGFAECDAEVRSEQTLASALAVLCKDKSADESINELLTLTGIFYGAEYAYIFEYGKDRKKIRSTYEWCAKDFASKKEHLQDIPAESVDSWAQKFKDKGVFFTNSLNLQVPREYVEQFALQGTASLIAAPIMKGDEIVGFIRIDNPTKAFNNAEVLKTIACISYGEILRRKEEDEEHITLEKLTEAFDTVFYVDLSNNFIHNWKVRDDFKDIAKPTDKYLESLDYYISKCVAEEDREYYTQMTRPESILNQFREKERFSIEYTDIVQGVARNFVNDFIKASNDGSQFIVCSKNVTEAIQKQKEQQEILEKALSETREANEKISEQSAFTSYFLESYQSAYYINLKTLSCQIYKCAKELDKNDPIFNNYVEFLNRHIQKEVQPNYRDTLSELIQPQMMQKMLAKQNEFFYIYKLISDNQSRTYRMQVIRGADQDHAALGFRDVTEEIQLQQEQQKNLERAESYKAVLNRFITGFEVSFVVNVKDNSFNELKKREDIHKKLGGNYVYSEIVSKYIETIYEDDREKMRSALKMENILEQLKAADEYTVRFRGMLSGVPLWYEVHIFKLSDNEFICAFTNVDATVSTELAHSAVSEDCYNIFLADLGSDIVKTIRSKKEFFRNEPRLPYNTYAETMTKIIADVPENYRPEWETLKTIDGVKEFIGKNNKRELVFQSLNDENSYVRCSWYVIEKIKEEPRTVCFAFSLLDKSQVDREKLNAKIAHQKLLLDYFVESYTSAYSVDLLNDTFEILHMEHDFSQVFHTGGDRNDMDKFISQHIHADDRDLMRLMSNKEYVVKRLRTERYYTFIIRENFDNIVKTMRVLIVRGIDEYHIAIGFMDITEELRKEREQQKQLEEALSMAQSANRAKTTFLNNMSHDIRTPMNAIIGYTGLAASHINNKEHVLDYLSKIGQSSNHLLSLINDVLDMSRIESGKMNLQEKEEKLSDIIHTLRDIVQADIHSKQLDFYVDAVDVNDEDIICDKLRLNQVLLNVLSNAIKYTAAGGTISMRVSEKTFKENSYGTYEFRIKDNGMGMSKEFLETIYDPFTRVKSTTVSGIQGTGLGMAITKNIIDMMGGSIQIQSEQGKGTEVTITFDFKFQKEPKSPIEIPELKGVRALIVDDDSNTCISVGKMLRDINMRDDWCTSGKEAIIRVQDAYQRGDQFKLYIIDWLMPDMNGIETTRRIRKIIGNEAQIIILTAYDWSDIEDEAKEAGVTSFISKPMFPSDLHKVLNSCLGKQCSDFEFSKNFDFSGKKVLLVEDNEFNRDIATELLEEIGFIVTPANDGCVAINLIKNAKFGDYDLILMDVQMPTIDGYEATKQIRALDTDLSKIPIIAMTANAFEEDRQKALEAGMNEHIAKPINLETLKATIAKILFPKGP